MTKDKHMFTSYLYHVTIISNTLRDFVINLFWNVFPIMFSNRFKYKSPSNDITRIWIISKKNLFKFNVLGKKEFIHLNMRCYFFVDSKKTLPLYIFRGIYWNNYINSMHLNTLKKTGLQCQKIKIEEKVQVHVSTVTNPYLTIIFMQVLFKIF